MDKIFIDVQTRDKSMKAKDLLNSGFIPVEFYGKGVENRSLQVDYQDFRRAYVKGGSNTVMEFNIDGKEKINVLVHNLAYHPVTDKFIHVDVMNVKMDEKVHAKIPLEFVGTSPAVKEQAGVLMTHLDEIEVSCLPGDLIHSIEVSLEPLVDFNVSINVSDLVVPDNVEVLNTPEDVVATVIAPREEEPEEPVEGAETLVDGEGEGEGESEEKSEEENSE